ncbi:zinc-binding alcohol dehydrogenase family protein [Pseudoxanthomonas sp.]|uniref:zinc-binding alcohol dehydrogenase family protein n=1 Tax=Pseudoxanthomonas sp. TaxID=1871049 RepID=UPI00263175CA|nr:zinc-binding alcohol dehydrogenase family protein [Pseudoxanthomonas sp.]WDS38088.1 MAG: zinc-binding alcohol dehydrogenase family protein [Pseudoxanthomonas sp.]
MKAIAYRKGSAASDPLALYEVERDVPTPGPHELLVRVRAVSVNPLDTKVRRGLVAVPQAVDVLGWDASGVVESVGSEVTQFRHGDEVFYAGSFHLAGSNAELQLVDARIVGTKPRSLDFAQAAAVPLAALTAWQLLFERLAVPRQEASAHATSCLLIVGGAGGVGSMLIQLARRLTSLTVIATASRPEGAAWCRSLGAHEVLDHRQPLAAQVRALGASVTHVASLTHTAQHLQNVVELMQPHGKLGVIDDHDVFDAISLKAKSLSLHWEMVFTRPMLQTADLVVQHRILEEVSQLIDLGVLRTTLATTLTPFNAASLRQAHQLVEAGGRFGKVVVADPST